MVSPVYSQAGSPPLRRLSPHPSCSFPPRCSLDRVVLRACGYTDRKHATLPARLSAVTSWRHSGKVRRSAPGGHSEETRKRTEEEEPERANEDVLLLGPRQELAVVPMMHDDPDAHKANMLVSSATSQQSEHRALNIHSTASEASARSATEVCIIPKDSVVQDYGNESLRAHFCSSYPAFDDIMCICMMNAHEVYQE